MRYVGGICIALFVALAGCGAPGSPALPAAPPGSSGATPPPFDAAKVHVSEISVSSALAGNGPTVLDVGLDGSVYFGEGNGAEGPGVYGLFRYSGGAFTQTQPYALSGVLEGGVDAIDAHDSSTVVWSTGYWPQRSSIPLGDTLECGASGGTAALCPSAGTAPGFFIESIVIPADGSLWLGGQGTGGNGVVGSPFTLPSNPLTLASCCVTLTNGPNQHVWGILVPAGAVYEFGAGGTIINTYAPESGTQVQGSQNFIEGPDGALWFTDMGHNAIGRITVSGQITEYPIPTANSGVTDIAAARDGGMWFTESSADKIGRIDATGAIHEFPLPTANAYPTAIAAVPPGASVNSSQIWFAEQNAQKIGSITY